MLPRNQGTILGLLAEDQSMIAYRPRLNEITGSVLATILLQQIIFRYVANGSQAFYKFKEPCSHPDYREGDSWTEELGFSRREFDAAFKAISTWVSKKKRQDNRTYYLVDVDSLEQKISELYGSPVLSRTADSAFRERRETPFVPLVSETTKEEEKRDAIPAPAGIAISLEGDEGECLRALRDCKSHPFQPNADLEYLRLLAKEYPLVDLPVVIRKYCLWIEAATNRKGSRSRILTFVSRANGDELKSSKPSSSTVNRFKGRA